MAIITQYVVTHKGTEKLVTTDKKEADQYDKMLDVAENLATFIEAKGIALEESVSEELCILLSKQKDALLKLFKGTSAQEILAKDSAEVVPIAANN